MQAASAVARSPLLVGITDGWSALARLAAGALAMISEDMAEETPSIAAGSNRALPGGAARAAGGPAARGGHGPDDGDAGTPGEHFVQDTLLAMQQR